MFCVDDEILSHLDDDMQKKHLKFLIMCIHSIHIPTLTMNKNGGNIEA